MVFFCSRIDFRALNPIARKDLYLPVRIDDCLDVLRSSTYLTSLDLAIGYYQIEMDEHSKDKKTFLIVMVTFG